MPGPQRSERKGHVFEDVAGDHEVEARRRKRKLDGIGQHVGPQYPSIEFRIMPGKAIAVQGQKHWIDGASLGNVARDFHPQHERRRAGGRDQ